MALVRDLLHPSPASELRKNKKKRLIQGPNAYFMDVKCPGCVTVMVVYSHAQTLVTCSGCGTVVCKPTGGKARLSDGVQFRIKAN